MCTCTYVWVCVWQGEGGESVHQCCKTLLSGLWFLRFLCRFEIFQNKKLREITTDVFNLKSNNKISFLCQAFGNTSPNGHDLSCSPMSSTTLLNHCLRSKTKVELHLCAQARYPGDLLVSKWRVEEVIQLWRQGRKRKAENLDANEVEGREEVSFLSPQLFHLCPVL